jgi:preprotein translocase subunit SecA
MFKKFFSIFSGDPTQKDLERYTKTADEIAALGTQYEQMSDEQLRAKTQEFKAQIMAARDQAGADEESQRKAEAVVLQAILHHAFALVRETSVRTIGMRHYEVQLIGGQVLHEGRIAEMRTGEGKTLVATLPLYLNALTGRGAHLVTVNDYLSRRDARWMAPIFHFHGLSVGILQDGSKTDFGRNAFIYDPNSPSAQDETHLMRLVPRREAYLADITYGTNNEFGFDYLRDNMEKSLEGRRQRGLNFAVVDEVDNVLIDEARTPLIISGPSHDDEGLYQELAVVVRRLQPDHYEINERDRSIVLNDMGIQRVEELLGKRLRDPNRPEDLTREQMNLQGHLEQALRAEFLFRNNVDYLVQAGKVMIVDTFTGRVMPGRRWSDGLHQAIEAKEGLKVEAENVTYATITLQNFYRMFHKLAGMSGTAETEAEEFDKIYRLTVVPIPTQLEFRTKRDPELVEVPYKENGYRFSYVARKSDPNKKPILHRRKDYDDLIFRTEEAKLRALIREVLARHIQGQPLLIGTTSVELSENVERRLGAEHLRRLANIWVLRSTWFEKNQREEDGREVPELSFMNRRIFDLNDGDLRTMARELDLRLNPSDPQNLARLLKILEIPDESIEAVQPRLLKALEGGIPNKVLNAKKHDTESQIIADAGKFGAVTIATNMAGRGVDIKLGGELAEDTLNAVVRVLKHNSIADPVSMSDQQRLAALTNISDEQAGIYLPQVQEFRQHFADAEAVRLAGGLMVLGSERHEARRIDNQLRGRAARQGDPGASRFYLSLEDELMRRFGGSNVSSIMERFKIDEAMPMEHGIVSKSVEQSQERVEGANFDTRKHLLEYDDVVNQQRALFYRQRDRIFLKEDLHSDTTEMLELEVQRQVDLYKKDSQGWWRLFDWLDNAQMEIVTENDKRIRRPLVQQRLNGQNIFSFSIERILEELAARVPSVAKAWDAEDQARDAILEAGEFAGEATRQAQAQAAFDAMQTALSTAMKDLPQVKETILQIAQASAETSRRYMLESIAQELADQQETIKGNIRARQESAELACEAAVNEARETGVPVQVRQVLKDILESTQVQLSHSAISEEGLNIDNLVARVKVAFEAHLGKQGLQALQNSISRRYGLPIAMTAPEWKGIQWDAYSEQVLAQLEKAHQTRTETDLAQIRTDLDYNLKDAPQLSRDAMGQIIRIVSYRREDVLDKKSGQMAQRIVQRFPYVYFAAKLMDGASASEMKERVLNHLNDVLESKELQAGENERQRLSNKPLADWEDTSLVKNIASQMGSAELDSQLPSGEFTGAARQVVRAVLGQAVALRAHRRLLVDIGDELWVEYLTKVEALRTSISLEAYGQRDPLVAYKAKAFEAFQQLLEDYRAGVVRNLIQFPFSIIGELTAPARPTPAANPNASALAKADSSAKVRATGKAGGTPSASQSLGRNDPCHCGSGKKYKNCHYEADERLRKAAQSRSGGGITLKKG